MANPLSRTQKLYLAAYMNKVSRSFTLVAPQVESPLSEYLAVAYLICRVVDNIEDCTLPYPQKRMYFTEFTHILASPEKAGEVLSRWQQAAWPGLSDDEKEMMGLEKGVMLWQIYAEMPAAYRLSIQEWAGAMAVGMAMVADLDQTGFFIRRNKVRMPVTAVDYDRYCFYVAGTVGRMITELAVTYYEISGADAETLLAYSEACGRALQKTNIVKDFAKDLARGFSYLPDEWLREVDYTPLSLQNVPAWWKKKVLLNVLAELEDSVNYVLSLPKTAVGYRKAGLLMMLPAYQTLLLASQKSETLFTPDHNVKISRPTMSKCVIQAQLMATNDEAIRTYGQDLSQQILQTLNIERDYTSANLSALSG